MLNTSVTKIHTSPDRHTFQVKSILEKLENDPNDESATYLLVLNNELIAHEDSKVSDPEWQKNNLEYDLRSTEWICNKAKNSKTYAQNLYCALCNNDFQKLDTIPILKDEKWSCSWRYAGGIIAHMTETGDYIDWYCSGIRDDYSDDFVSEGVVTDEIQQDLGKLGWSILY